MAELSLFDLANIPRASGQSLDQLVRPPRNPGRAPEWVEQSWPVQMAMGAITGIPASLKDAYDATRGRMTESEAGEFATMAALGMLPMRAGLRSMTRAASAANNNASRAEILDMIGLPKQQTHAEYVHSKVKMGTPEDVLASDAIWAKAPEMAKAQNISTPEAFAQIANGVWAQMGANRYMTPQMAQNYINETHAKYGSVTGGRAMQPAPASLPMDEASRMARADDLGFRRNMPISYGKAPEGEKIAGAAIHANDQVYKGPDHFGAITQAEKELGIPFEKMALGPIPDGFVTTAGRYVSRREATDIAARGDQGAPSGLFGIARGLASENTKMAAPGRSQSSVHTGATAPGLPGGSGVWGRLLPEGSPTANALWHRAERPGGLDARGLRDHEIQESLKASWDDGFDAVKIRNYTTPTGKVENVIVVKNLSQLRSPDAAFDPAKKNSANLLAGLAGLSAVPAGLMLSDLGQR